MPEPFKLTDEMIKSIEEKVNNGLVDVNSGMKDRLIAAGCYNECSFFAACWVTIDIENSNVMVIDPIRDLYDEDEDDDKDMYSCDF